MDWKTGHRLEELPSEPFDALDDFAHNRMDLTQSTFGKSWKAEGNRKGIKIIHGDIIIERKSSFVAHFATVSNLTEVSS